MLNDPAGSGERRRTSDRPPSPLTASYGVVLTARPSSASACRKLLFPLAFGPTSIVSGPGRTSHEAMLL